MMAKRSPVLLACAKRLGMASTAVPLIATIVALPVAQAATRTWQGTGGSASFSTATNWGTGGVPGSADTAAFTGSTATICNITTSPTVAAITVSGNATLAITAGQVLKVTGDYTQTSNTPAVTVTGGILQVSGAFNQSAGSFTQSSGTLLLDATSAKNLVTHTASFFDLAINDGLVAYWKFDDTATPSLDSSGWGRSAAWFNSTTSSTTVATPTLNFANSRSLRLASATSDYATISSPDITSITIAGWVHSISRPNDFARVMDMPAFELSFADSTQTSPQVANAVGWTVFNSGGQYSWRTGANSIGDAAWYHIAVTFTGTNTGKIYINGVNQSLTTTATDAGTVVANNTTGYIGNSPAFDRDWNGYIDDLRIYNRVLDASEIYALYAGNQPGTGSGVQTLSGTPTVSNDLILASGTLSVGSGNLTVSGSWNNYGGLFTAGSSTVTLNSTTGEVIRSAGQSFTNLILSGSGATWTLEDWMRVSGTLTLTNGALSPGAYAVHVADLVKTSGTLTAGTGTVVIDTTTAPAGNGSGFGLTFNNLRIESPKETGLVAYWKLDEGQGDTVRDASGTGNNGTLSGDLEWIGASASLPPLITFDNHAALGFNGSNTSVPVGIASMPTGGAARSVTAWFNLNVLDANTRQFLNLRDAGGTNTILAVGIKSSNLQAWGAGGIVYATVSPPSTGSWHFVAYTYDGTNHSISLDGGTPGTSTTTHTAFAVATARLGSRDGTTEMYDGLLDDVRMYDFALTANQVANMFAGRYSGVGGGATVTLGANLTVNKTLAIDNGTLDTSSYTINAAATDSTQTALVNAGTLKLGSARATFNGGLTVGAQATVTENTAGGAIALGAGEALEYGYSGTIQGFPTAAFDWNSFTFWREYVTYRSYTGSGTATDTVLALTADGGTKYPWPLPTSKGSLLGTPRWNTEVISMVTYHYIYLITTLGYVYKVEDTGSALTTVSGGAWPYRNVTGGTSATATSPLVTDASNLYWSGNDGGGLPKFFSLTLAGSLNAALVITATSSAAPALATINSIPYVFFAISGKVYQETLNLGSQFTSTQPTSTVNGRISFLGSNLYFPENNGTIQALTATSTAGPTTVSGGGWPYQDRNATRHISTCSGSPFTCPAVSNIYVDIAQSRICFGDADGHVYVLNSAGAPLTGFPWQPGSSADNFQTAPLSRNGVLLIGAANGNLYEIDENNGTTRALTRTYVLPAAVSNISYNPSANGGSGGYLVGAGGKLYYLGVASDPSGPI